MNRICPRFHAIHGPSFPPTLDNAEGTSASADSTSADKRYNENEVKTYVKELTRRNVRIEGFSEEPPSRVNLFNRKGASR